MDDQDNQDNYAVGPLPTLMLRGDNVSQLDWGIRNILITCLDTSSDSLQGAVIGLASLRPSTRHQTPQQVLESDTTFFRRFWRTFLKLTKQIACNDTNQDNFVTLVDGLSSLPSPDESTVNVWHDLPGLSAGIGKIWLEPTSDEDNYEAFSEWVNLNAFVSRLYNDDHVNFYGLGIQALRHALEDDQDPDDMVAICRQVTAAQWMIYSADKLYWLMVEDSPDEEDQRLHRSRRFEGEMVFSFGRWMFWKQAFINISVPESDAARAVESMDLADGSQQS